MSSNPTWEEMACMFVLYMCAVAMLVGGGLCVAFSHMLCKKSISY